MPPENASAEKNTRHLIVTVVALGITDIQTASLANAIAMERAEITARRSTDPARANRITPVTIAISAPRAITISLNVYVSNNFTDKNG